MLCTHDSVGGDRVWGALPPLPTTVPWWPEVWDVVAAAKQAHDLDVTVLRLLGASIPRMPGGTVTYLAEVSQRPELPLAPWSGDALADHPLRQSWARPGGARRHLTWALDHLVEAGIASTGAPVQVKSWNLSTVWRLPTEHGHAWLKVVPDFFAHEAAIMARLGSPTTPAVYAAEPGRTLMADAPGLNFDTSGSALAPMVEMLTTLQAEWIGRTDELLALGLPDRRLAAERPRIERVVAEHLGELPQGDRHAVVRLVEGLDARIDAVGACGIPETLIHGDFHSGNVAGMPGDYVILDWGDSAVSHPLFDELAFTRPLGELDRADAARWFGDAWRQLVPGCDPDRAAHLLRPVVALMAAVMYAGFCDQIEPDERIYHAADVPEMLTLAAAAIRS